MKYEYVVVCETRTGELERKVNERLADGFKPVGGIAVDGGGYKFQAVVKITEEDGESDV